MLGEVLFVEEIGSAMRNLLVIWAKHQLGPDRRAAEKGSSWSSGIESGGATPVSPLFSLWG